MMTAERHNISIELKSDLTFGQSVVDYFNKDCADKPQSNVVISIDSAKYAAVMPQPDVAPGTTLSLYSAL